MVIIKGIDTSNLPDQSETSKAGTLKGWTAEKLFSVLELLGSPKGTIAALQDSAEFSYLLAPEFSEDLKQLENTLYRVEQQAKQGRRKLRQKSDYSIAVTAGMFASVLTLTLRHLQAGDTLNVRRFLTEYQPNTWRKLTPDEADKVKQRCLSTAVKRELRTGALQSKLTELGKVTSRLTKSEQGMLLKGTIADAMKMLELFWKQQCSEDKLAQAPAVKKR